jgi:hypothetical protein
MWRIGEGATISACMYKPSHASIFGLVGLTAFGVAYDSGLFGTPDGHDHSAVIAISVAASTGSLAIPMYAVMNNVTGDNVAIYPPETINVQTR